MPVSLTRIEREYILQSLKDDLPSLTIFTDAGSFIVATYKYRENTLEWKTETLVPLQGTIPAQILFTHKKRAMRFTTNLICTAAVISCTIPQIIYPEESSRELDTDHVVLPCCNGFRLAVFPVTNSDKKNSFQLITNPNPARLEKLGEKIGLFERDIAAISKLEAYLQKVQGGILALPNDQDNGHIIHCDHRTILLAFPTYSIAEFTAANPFSLTILFTKRKITCTARSIGTLSITDRVGILAASYISVQEEDKRFLFERYYGKKYTDIE